MDKSFLKIAGIKCDAPGCDYREDDIPMEDYEEWLDRECPECGANLLTEADLNTVKILMATVALANKLEDNDGDLGPRVQGNIEMDGSGEIKFKDMKLKD